MRHPTRFISAGLAAGSSAASALWSCRTSNRKPGVVADAALLATLSVALFAALPVTPAVAAAPTPTRAAEPTIDYTVTRGDNLFDLSRNRFASMSAWREIAQLNRLPDPARISPGQRLRVPLRLLRPVAAPARLAAVTGDVSIGNAAAIADARVSEGQSVRTGDNASAVLELADGSRVKLAPSSLAEVVAARRYDIGPAGGAAGSAAGAAADTAGAAAASAPANFAGTLRLVRGAVEVLASKLRRAKPLEVTTPTAVIGVRGTEFRVRLDDAAPVTRTEVLEGRVHVDANGASRALELNPDFGTVIGAPAGLPGNPGARTGGSASIRAAVTTAIPVASPLPAAPDLSGVPERFERPVVRFRVAAESGVLRLQVAQDAAFDHIVRDQVAPAGSELRVAGLDDGTWFLRLRRQDAIGLEGRDSVQSFVLKARPEPPASLAPRPDAKASVGPVEFSWAQSIDGGRVRLQVARDEAFTDIVTDQDALAGASTTVDLPDAGRYHWRLQSIRPDGDHGPFGDPLSFELRPLPAAPTGGLSPDGRTLALAWTGRPQDRQQVELARDPQFSDGVVRDELAASRWELARPSPDGAWYFRYRSVEPDGFVTGYSPTMRIDLPSDWRPLLLLAPLLMLF